MRYEIIPLKIATHRAEALEKAGELIMTGWNVNAQDVTPFEVVWPTQKIFQEPTRFSLPALSFKGNMIGQAGFYGTKGFIAIREGLDDKVKQAAQRRFQQLADSAHNFMSFTKSASNRLIKMRKEILTQDPCLNVYDEHEHRFRYDLLDQFKETPPSVVRQALVQKLNVNNKISFAHEGDTRRGSLRIMLTENDPPVSLHILTYSWSAIETMRPWTYRTSLDCKSDADKFVYACVNEFVNRHSVYKKNNVAAEELSEEVSNTDFGY